MASGDEQEIEQKDFVCEICSQAFSTKAGLSRHKGVKHGETIGKRWANPYIASMKRRSRLQEAIALATDDDLIEFVAPRMSKILSPWDHLLMRSEQGEPPLPHVPSLVFEYWSLAEQARAFLAEHLTVKVKALPQKPAPASVKRKRRLRKDGLEEDKEASEDEAHADDEDDDDEDDEDDNNGAVIVRIDTEEQSGALGLPIGRYLVEEPLKEEFLPRRFRSILAAQRIAAENVQHEGLIRPGDEENQPPSPLHDEESMGSGAATALRMAAKSRRPKRAVVAVETAVEKEAVEGKAIQSIHDAELGEDLLIMPEGGLSGPVPDEWLQSGSFMAVLTESGATSDLVMEAATGKLYHKPTGHLVTLAGSNIDTSAVIVGEEEEMEQDDAKKDGADSSDAAAGDTKLSSIDIESLYPGVSVSEVSPGVSIVTKPNGARFQVEHRGEGITLETLQAVMDMDD